MVVYVDRSAAERAIACFVTAFAHCRPAGRTQTVPGTDTGDSYTFVVERAKERRQWLRPGTAPLVQYGER